MTSLILVGGLWTRRLPLIVAAVLAILFTCHHARRLNSLELLRSELANEVKHEFSGIITRRSASGLVKAEFRLEGGERLALYHLPEHIRAGERVRITGFSLSDERPRNPGQWDLAAQLTKQGLAGGLVVETVERLGLGSPVDRLRGGSEWMRDELSQLINESVTNEANAAIIRGVVLGEKGEKELMLDFRKTGTMHVFAVSGLHVGLVAAFALALGRIVRLNRTTSLWLMLVIIFAYVLITGMRPPATRAALMATFLAGGFLLRRQTTVLNSLFAAALVVLALDSFQLWQLGFQLSFWVVSIILVLEPKIWSGVGRFLLEDPYLPKPLWSRTRTIIAHSKEKLGRMTTVSLAAWIGSAPLTLYYFAWFTPIATLSSVVMVVLAFAIICTAFVALPFSLISKPLSEAVFQGSAASAHLARLSAAEMASWPGAWMRGGRRAPWSDGLIVFDVPFGGAAAHWDQAGGILIDGGSERGFPFEIGSSLETYGMTADSLIATHEDEQHVGGFVAALEHFPVRQVLVPDDSGKGIIGEISNIAKDREIPVVTAAPNTTFPVNDDCNIEVLSTGKVLGRADDRVLVLMLHWHGWRILMTSDAGRGTEERLLKNPKSISADLWIMGRHLYEPTGSDEFVNRVNPRAIIASHQGFPSDERIPAGWREWVVRKGINLLSQDEHGAVMIKASPERLQLEGYLTGESVILERSGSESP
ncbi:MAG: ComEC/Rec2 family competence protein [Verrucomicrobiota bacterium JB023]|nr:ComEC/Rec2 family competence protein [Verrucomicrobiota bacterium JB023]